MATEDIPQHVAEFLVRDIDSVIQLEALLLLHARGQQSPWHPADVARELRIDAEWTQAALAKLTSAGILRHESSNGSFIYAPSSSELDRTIDALAKIYAQRRVSVISLIFSKPLPDPIRQFTDAFRFRKDDHGSS